MSFTRPIQIAESMSITAPPRVSVIVPAFNAANFLGEALSSLRAQTIADIEIIVVDDGSTDGTSAIARSHAAEDARVRLLSRASPSGKPSCARNQALGEARGRYIAFLDADDVSVPHRLESALHALRVTGCLFVFSEGMKTPARSHPRERWRRLPLSMSRLSICNRWMEMSFAAALPFPRICSRTSSSTHPRW